MPRSSSTFSPALLMWRKARCLRNAVASLTSWEWGRNSAFALAGLGLLWGLHHGFYRLLSYLGTVELIGGLLLWKLTALMMLTTFTMVSISGLLTSLTTLYYSQDLKFLMNQPLSPRVIFLDKALESAFFASWMIGLVLVPYVLALVRVNAYGASFFLAFLGALVPFLLLASAVGIAFTLALLTLFPSSRTRDAVWILATLSLTLVYGLVRFAEPERLIRPDALRVVAEYLHYLQAPTAPYLPSWWLTRGLTALAAGRPGEYWRQAALLWGCAGAAYGLLVVAAGRWYFQAYSGAQEGALRRRTMDWAPLPEARWLTCVSPELASLFWRERTTFFRDVKHWSQMLLIAGLVFVYLFSIRRLPLDNADLRSLVSFLNIGTAGFVIAALGLRFTYPAVSLEGRSWWVVRSAPVTVGALMRQKFLFSALPMAGIALTLGLMTNHLLDADRFTSWVSVASLLVMALALCAMGVGFGALFPLFNVENIHQIESSLGGFVYMASALAYVGANIMVLSWPMQMHFQQRFGKAGAWDWRVAGLCAAVWLALSLAAFSLPWALGRRNLEAYEEKGA